MKHDRKMQRYAKRKRDDKKAALVLYNLKKIAEESGCIFESYYCDGVMNFED